jgi:hypothetical protein
VRVLYEALGHVIVNELVDDDGLALARQLHAHLGRRGPASRAFDRKMQGRRRRPTIRAIPRSISTGTRGGMTRN